MWVEKAGEGLRSAGADAHCLCSLPLHFFTRHPRPCHGVRLVVDLAVGASQRAAIHLLLEMAPIQHPVCSDHTRTLYFCSILNGF